MMPCAQLAFEIFIHSLRDYGIGEYKMICILCRLKLICMVRSKVELQYMRSEKSK